MFIFCTDGYVYAKIFIIENWDTGTPPTNWPCQKAALNQKCSETDSFGGWVNAAGYYCDDTAANPGWENTKLSSTYAHSGTYSFRMYRSSQTNGSSCDIRHLLTEPYPTAIYVRFYIYFPSSMTSYNTPTTQEPFTHFLFTNSAFSGTGFRMNLLSKVPYTSPWQCASGIGGVPAGIPYMWFNCEVGNTSCKVGAPYDCYNLIAPSNLNRWQCVEFYFNASTNKMSIWIDGDKKVNEVSVPISTAQSNFKWLQFSAFESQLPTRYNMDYYIDDIIVSDSYIGPSLVTPANNTLKAPEGLKVVGH
jgi:hypothetical protein